VATPLETTGGKTARNDEISLFTFEMDPKFSKIFNLSVNFFTPGFSGQNESILQDHQPEHKPVGTFHSASPDPSSSTKHKQLQHFHPPFP